MNSYSIFPLGDSAVTLDLGGGIDELHNIRVQAIHDWLQARRFPGILDVIVAYSSVSVFFDPAIVRASGIVGAGTVISWVEALMIEGWEACVGSIVSSGDSGAPRMASARHLFRIPVCYEGKYAPDLDWVSQRLGLRPREVMDLHCAGVYRVYMLGFLPGFPYLGSIDRRLEVPRKMQPVAVTAGGVGITGMQTGIYPLNSPGGWQIIGRTPVRLFDPKADPPVFLQQGDQVQFYPIGADEFERMAASSPLRPG